MGESPNDRFANRTERPAHSVRISTFAMGREPVTVGEMRAFRADFAADDAVDLPAVNVSWEDAAEFCRNISHRTGRTFRLPSEAEWEYACRAGTRTIFGMGDAIEPTMANYLYDESGARVGPGRRTPAGTFPANAFGLHDMHGNVCEWVGDVWHDDYEFAPDDGSAWTRGDGGRRVLRGGAWDYLPRLLRAAWRDSLPPNTRRDNVGFRVATSDIF